MTSKKGRQYLRQQQFTPSKIPSHAYVHKVEELFSRNVKFYSSVKFHDVRRSHIIVKNLAVYNAF